MKNQCSSMRCALQKTEGFVYLYLKHEEQGRDGLSAWAECGQLSDEKRENDLVLFAFHLVSRI